MNAFCNADDISWGTKNLDTKRADHDAAKMRSKALAYKGEGHLLLRLSLHWMLAGSIGLDDMGDGLPKPAWIVACQACRCSSASLPSVCCWS